MKCKYRKCDKELPEQVGAGRKRIYCVGGNCKRMELYYKHEDNKKVSGND